MPDGRSRLDFVVRMRRERPRSPPPSTLPPPSSTVDREPDAVYVRPAVITGEIQQGLQADVDQCVVQTLRNLQFPAPTGGGTVEVTYPFTFAPS